MTTVQLLWTGGFDSTFRLVDLLRRTECIVQTHYVVDPQRRSTARELAAMAEIRALLLTDTGAERLPPTRITLLGDFPALPEHRQAYRELAAELPLGTQYPWLADYAAFAGGGYEMAIVKPGNLGNLLQERVTVGGPRIAIRPGLGPWSRLFERFTFPMLELSKHDLEELVSERGYAPVTDLTWFCHRPISGAPCGQCKPCIVALNAGRRVRFGPLALARYQRQRLLARWFGGR